MSFSKQPEEDNDLTNLSWLHHVSSILPATTKHDEKLAKTPKTKKPSTQKALKNAAVTTHELEHRHLKLIQDGTYKKNSKGKPPFSYAALICLAMKSYSHGHDKISLSQIIAWIKTHFEYYRLSDPSWQNSIRHNLSLNKCFIKVARDKAVEPGKGGFWMLHPKYADSIASTSANVTSDKSQSFPGTTNSISQQYKSRKIVVNDATTTPTCEASGLSIVSPSRITHSKVIKKTKGRKEPPSDVLNLPLPDATPAIRLALQAIQRDMEPNKRLVLSHSSGPSTLQTTYDMLKADPIDILPGSSHSVNEVPTNVLPHHIPVDISLNPTPPTNELPLNEESWYSNGKVAKVRHDTSTIHGNEQKGTQDFLGIGTPEDANQGYDSAEGVGSRSFLDVTGLDFEGLMDLDAFGMM